MLLITSAFPFLKRLDENGVDVGQDLVRDCILSWQANGFDVLSVHNEAERDRIGAGLPGVTYRFVQEDLPPGARKMPSLAAVLSDLPPNEPIGIINADLFMPRCLDLAERMDRLARESTLIMHRWEVPSITRRKGKRFDLGVDLFAFTPSLIAPALEGLIKRPYQLGVPWWDYALPLAASLYSRLSLVSDPILLHHTHDQAWNDREWHDFADISETYLIEQAKHPLADQRRAEQLTERLGEIDEYYAGEHDRFERHYALGDLTLHLIQTMSSQHTVSLLADMSFAVEDDDPWLQRSEREAGRHALLQQRRAAATIESHTSIPVGAPTAGGQISSTPPTAQEELLKYVSAEALPREQGRPTRLAIYDEVTDETSAWQLVVAGLSDLWAVIMAIGKLLERRFRRWRRRKRLRLPTA